MPAEWARHEGTWLTWPTNRITWPGKMLKEVEDIYLQMMTALLPGERVHLLVPNGKEGAGEYRSLTLLSFQTPNQLTLYVRVEDVATGTLFGTYPMGRLIAGSTPIGEFDNENTLHVFHMTGPSQYMLTKIGVNGEWLGQSLWNAPRGRAVVRKKADGTMVVVGATREKPAAATALPVPKISDRPPASPPR